MPEGEWMQLKCRAENPEIRKNEDKLLKMAIEVPQDKENFGGGKNGGRKEVGSANRRGIENKGGVAHIRK